MARKQDGVSFSFTSDGASGEEQAEGSAPGGPPHRRFRILIMSDFSGRTNRSLCEPETIGDRKVRTIDVDNLDATLAGLKAELRLPVDEKSVMTLTFASMDDFRPDALLQKVPAFQTMLMLREQLQNSGTFAQAAAVVRKLTGTERPAAAQAETEVGSGESEFEKMLNRPVAQKDATQVSADALIANLTAGYAVPAADPEQKELVAVIEEALAAGLRVVLRHPALQALEAAWRGVAFLTSRLSTDAEVSLNILDVSRDELHADLIASGRKLETTGFHGQMVERFRAPGGVPVSLVIGDYLFDQSAESVALLEKVGAVMQAAGISFVTGASPRVAGVGSFAELARIQGAQWKAPTDLGAWQQLRGSAVAENLGVTAPRILLRLPYGPKTDAVDAFPFNEMPAGPVHEQYLWGNGALAVALLIGEAILENGFDGASEAGNDVSDLPCHMAVVDGDREMTPCAEVYLTDRTADNLRSLGLIPIASVKNAAAVKVAGLQSLAKGRGLAGLG